MFFYVYHYTAWPIYDSMIRLYLKVMEKCMRLILEEELCFMRIPFDNIV